MVKKIFFIVLGLVLVVSSIVYYKSKTSIDNPSDVKVAPQPIQVDHGIQVKSEYISSAECRAAGGGIITLSDPEKKECPDNKIFLGMVNDVNCICACCK